MSFALTEPTRLSRTPSAKPAGRPEAAAAPARVSAITGVIVDYHAIFLFFPSNICSVSDMAAGTERQHAIACDSTPSSAGPGLVTLFCSVCCDSRTLEGRPAPVLTTGSKLRTMSREVKIAACNSHSFPRCPLQARAPIEGNDQEQV